jgi:hypothetical protein
LGNFFLTPDLFEEIPKFPRNLRSKLIFSRPLVEDIIDLARVNRMPKSEFVNIIFLPLVNQQEQVCWERAKGEKRRCKERDGSVEKGEEREDAD